MNEEIKVNEPIFGKSHPRPDHYKPITWKIFLNIRKWAESMANELGYPVYLVGSALYKEIPRDIDVSVIMPYDDYIAKYGELPKEQSGYDKYLYNVHVKNEKQYCDCLDVMCDNGFICIDLKICPDTWFREKPKLLLAEPKK